MSGTSMAAPQVAGMAALVAQYIREEGLARKTGLTPRQLAQSLLMSTAVPQMEDYGEDGHGYYPVLRQGAGLANVGKALAADSYILMGEDAGGSYADGKVKVELGDDPERNGTYTFSFSIHNLTNEEKTYALSADFFTQDLFTHAVNNDGDQGDYMDTWTTALDAEVTFDVGQAVTVPANGSKDVQVTVRLTDGQKAALKQYPAGAYIQGYVYAKSGSTEEGVEGTEHSIPVLGFYGSWSEASMFEVVRVEYDAGAEVRLPYLGNTKVNTAVITMPMTPGTKYYFGGNPLVADAGYMPSATPSTAKMEIRSARSLLQSFATPQPAAFWRSTRPIRGNPCWKATPARSTLLTITPMPALGRIPSPPSTPISYPQALRRATGWSCL